MALNVGRDSHFSMRHNSDFLHEDSGSYTFGGTGSTLEPGLYRGRANGTPEHVVLTKAPRIIIAPVDSSSGSLNSIDLPTDYTNYRRISGTIWQGSTISHFELDTAMLAAQGGTRTIDTARHGGSRSRLNWDPTTRVISQGNGQVFLHAELSD